MDLEKFLVNPATLMVLIFGIVEFTKTFGLKGNVLRIVSLLIGMVLALVFKLRDLFPAYAIFVDLFFFSTAAGLAACGIYDFARKFRPVDPQDDNEAPL
jgi:hypothetical protein